MEMDSIFTDTPQTDPQIHYNPYQISSFVLCVCFSEIDKLILKFIWTWKRPKIESTILKRKNSMEDSYFLISKLNTKLQ